jgi:hypothetical protein
MFAIKSQSHDKSHVFDVVTQFDWLASKVESEAVVTTVVQSFIRGLGTA